MPCEQKGTVPVCSSKRGLSRSAGAFLTILSWTLAAATSVAADQPVKLTTGKPNTARVIGLSDPIPKISTDAPAAVAKIDTSRPIQRLPVRLPAFRLPVAGEARGMRGSVAQARHLALQEQPEEEPAEDRAPAPPIDNPFVEEASEEDSPPAEFAPLPAAEEESPTETIAPEPTAEEESPPETISPGAAAGEGPGVRGSATSFGLKPMSQLSISIAAPQPDEGFPENFGTKRFAKEPVIASAEFVGRDWPITDYRWEASRLCHGPIIFEQLNAERYGITYGCLLQPVVSGAHFFATVPIIPYKVWAQGHDQCQYSLGYYRPGSLAQPQCYRPRISADAGLFEAGIILGLIFALP